MITAKNGHRKDWGGRVQLVQGNVNPCCGSTRNNLTPQPKTQVKQARTSQHITNISQEPLFSNPPPPMIQDQRKQANIKTCFCFRWLQIHDKTLDVRWLPSLETDYPSLVVKANNALSQTV